MKINTTKLLLFACSVICSFNVAAQNYFYIFSQSTGTYTDLTGATVLSTDLSATYHDYPLPHGFKLYDKNVGNFLQIGRSGWSITSTNDYFMAYDPYLPAKGLTARPTGSSISVKTETTASDTIV